MATTQKGMTRSVAVAAAIGICAATALANQSQTNSNMTAMPRTARQSVVTPSGMTRTLPGVMAVQHPKGDGIMPRTETVKSYAKPAAAAQSQKPDTGAKAPGNAKRDSFPTNPAGLTLPEKGLRWVGYLELAAGVGIVALGTKETYKFTRDFTKISYQALKWITIDAWEGPNKDKTAVVAMRLATVAATAYVLYRIVRPIVEFGWEAAKTAPHLVEKIASHL